MKSLISRLNRGKAFLSARWSAEDYPGGDPRFQLSLFTKDVGVFILLPVVTVIIFKSCEKARQPPKKPNANQQTPRADGSKSQIIDFKVLGRGTGLSISRKTPGALVKLKLLNVVETYSNAPVHAQIVDTGLGRSLLGGTLIGDATPDPTFERISITFQYARDPNRESVAYPISAKALSLDGTLGIVATKKEEFFTRAVLGSANGALSKTQANGNSADLKDMLFRALSAGFLQEFSTGTQVEKNRSQVLTLQPDTEFMAELTDYFPGATK